MPVTRPALSLAQERENKPGIGDGQELMAQGGRVTPLHRRLHVARWSRGGGAVRRVLWPVVGDPGQPAAGEGFLEGAALRLHLRGI